MNERTYKICYFGVRYINGTWVRFFLFPRKCLLIYVDYHRLFCLVWKPRIKCNKSHQFLSFLSTRREYFLIYYYFLTYFSNYDKILSFVNSCILVVLSSLIVNWIFLDIHYLSVWSFFLGNICNKYLSNFVRKKVDIGIKKWIKKFVNAQSFHNVVISIIRHAPFDSNAFMNVTFDTFAGMKKEEQKRGILTSLLGVI